MNIGGICLSFQPLVERKMNKVSIIVPAYNVEKYIYRAIESALGQDYPNIELVVVDDGSTDGTLDVIKEYSQKDSRIIWKIQKNQGVSTARNNGINTATGKYFLFLDSDDWLERDAVSYLVELQNKYPDNLVSGDRFFAYINKSGSLIRERQREGNGVIQIGLNESIATLSTGEYNLQSSCYKLFERNKVGTLKFNESISHGEDGLFVFEYLLKCRGLVFSNKPLWNILERPNSATQAPYNTKWLSAIKAAEIMKRFEFDELSKRALSLNLIDRIEMVMNAMLKSEDLHNEDYECAKRSLKQYSHDFWQANPTIKMMIKFICYLYVPQMILKIIINVSSKRLRMIA